LSSRRNGIERGFEIMGWELQSIFLMVVVTIFLGIGCEGSTARKGAQNSSWLSFDTENFKYYCSINKFFVK